MDIGAQRLKFVDGLRAVALLMVMLRHFYMDGYPLGLPSWTRVFGLGYLGVTLFLLLSGFCISWAYFGPRARKFSLYEFVKLRARRILPAYYVATAIAVALVANTLSFTELAWQTLTHALLIHNWFPSTVMGLPGPFWSLALECQLYAFFPLLLVGFTRFGPWRTLALVLALQTAYRIYVMRFGTDYTNLTFVLPWGVLGRLFEFALGMLAAQLVAHGTLTSRPRWRQALPFVTAFGLCLGLVAKSRLGVTHPLTDALWLLGFFGLLLWAASGRRLNALLSFRPLVVLGVASYSGYLIHELAMPYVFEVLTASTTFVHWAAYFTPVVLGLALLPCFGFFYLVEQPAMNWFKSRSAKQRVTLGANV